MATVTDPIGVGLSRTLKTLKLSGLKDALPERLVLARQIQMSHAAFLELLLADEVTRRNPLRSLDDFALRPLDPTQTNYLYELVVERHRKHPTIRVSNREPAEWLSMTTDALLTQIRRRPAHLQRPHPDRRGALLSATTPDLNP